MPIRRPSHKERRIVDLRDFGWSAAHVAVLRHSTLLFDEAADGVCDAEGVSLETAKSWGRRDRLALLAQFAAHIAFLKRAAVPPGALQIEEWIVSRSRGEDPRLIRIRAAAAADSFTGALDAVAAFAAFLRVEAAQLDASWTRVEHVWSSAVRLMEMQAGESTWTRRAAVGWIEAPGIAAAEELLAGAAGVHLLTRDGIEAFLLGRSLRRLSACVEIGAHASPLDAWSAFRKVLPASSFRNASLSEGKVAELLLEHLRESGTECVVIRNLSSFDERSPASLRIATSSAGSLTWIVERTGEAMPLDGREWPSRELIVISSSLARSRELESLLSSQEIDRVFARLADVDLSQAAPATPAASAGVRLETIAEPRRSYLAALATLGASIPSAFASGFLEKIGCRLTLSDVVNREVGRIDEERVLLDRGVCAALQSSLPEATKIALARTALELDSEALEESLRIRLLVAADDAARAVAMLERSLPPVTEPWSFDDAPAQLFELSEELRWRRFFELFRSGRYSAAQRDAETLTDRRAVAEALLERRLGRYSAALSRLPSSPVTAFALTLKGELERLVGEHVLAGKTLDAAIPLAETAFDLSSARFARALLDLDLGRQADARDLTAYQTARVAAYGAMSSHDFRTARSESKKAIELSRFLIEKIDSSLDLLYALFVEGSWEEARHHARVTLALVEESDGDRAIAGVLFTLGYLCADAGQWEDAVSMAERLRKHFVLSDDERRLKEVDLLLAQVALGRCELLEASRRASGLDDSRVDVEIREAAALVLDDVAWCLGEKAPIRSRGNATCHELRARHGLMVMRRDPSAADAVTPFLRELGIFERKTLAGRKADLPATSNATEDLQLIRSLLALAARGISIFDRELLELCDRRRVIPPERSSASLTRGSEHYLDTIVQFAQRDYPFTEEPLGIPWKIASCNRLGAWEQVGEAAPVDDTMLARLLVGQTDDWYRLAERTFFYLPNLVRWRADHRDGLLRLVASKLEVHRLRRLVEQDTPAATVVKREKIAGIIGESEPMQKLLEMLPRLAARDVPICILGESGSGKERIASTVHDMSTRRSRKFTAVNCAALPEQLLESELFGHVRGAFTGADRDKQGLIEVTDGGTLFLDEVGELPLAAQAKLLRFLQEGEYRRVGDTSNRTADVRIVAATNRKLESAVDEGKFREDLYYRIRGIELTVPPLRERGSDILLIAKHFLERETKKHRGGPSRFSKDVELVMLSYNWPGNVRELENMVRAAHALAAEAKEIDLDHLPDRLRGVLVVRRATGTFFEEMTRFRKNLVEKSLSEANGNQSQAAKMLGMSRQALAYQIRELGILVKSGG